MPAPFKQLAYHEKQLEADLMKLRSEHPNAGKRRQVDAVGHDELTAEDQDEEKVPNLTNEDIRSKGLKALEELECLMAMYRYWIQPRWQWLRSKQIEDVAFRDMSMLFQPGDFLYVPQETQKLFRIFKVTDGRPKLAHLYSDDFSGGLQTADRGKSSTSKDSNSRDSGTTKWVDLQLDCYFLDFDGREVGAVHFSWSFKPWPGRKKVTKLKAYPLRLAPDAAKLEADLRATGTAFLEAYDTPVRYYEGRSHADRAVKDTDSTWRPGRLNQYRPILTTKKPPNPEDVASQVVVDFERCFQVSTATSCTSLLSL